MNNNDYRHNSCISRKDIAASEREIVVSGEAGGREAPSPDGDSRQTALPAALQAGPSYARTQDIPHVSSPEAASMAAEDGCVPINKAKGLVKKYHGHMWRPQVDAGCKARRR